MRAIIEVSYYLKELKFQRALMLRWNKMSNHHDFHNYQISFPTNWSISNSIHPFILKSGGGVFPKVILNGK
jgi:hypothetical protein